jgi:hypothetical protein
MKRVIDLAEFCADQGDHLFSQDKNSSFATKDVKQLQEDYSKQQENTKILDSCYRLLQQIKK